MTGRFQTSERSPPTIMLGANPNLIQGFDPGPWQGTVPLVLIHDGGGTIFSYYCLGHLERPVYGIYNPRYGTRQPWAGGLSEMGRHYARLIRDKVLPRGGPVILGGWSLGGLLSLQVAHELAKDDGGCENAIQVLAMVMVDSACPIRSSDGRPKVVPHMMQWGATTQPHTKESVTWCFDQAIKMVSKWQLPRWDDHPAVTDSDSASAGEMLPKGLGQHLPKGPPPPVILLKAVDKVPVAKATEGGVCRTDVHRKDAVLGWRQYRADLIHKVEDIPGHHFNIFSNDKNLDAVTAKLKDVCRDIEDGALRCMGAEPA